MISINLKYEGGQDQFTSRFPGMHLAAINGVQFSQPLLVEDAQWDREPHIPESWRLILTVWLPEGPMLEMVVLPDVTLSFVRPA